MKLLKLLVLGLALLAGASFAAPVAWAQVSGQRPADQQQMPSLQGHWRGVVNRVEVEHWDLYMAVTGPNSGTYRVTVVTPSVRIDDAGTWFLTADNVLSSASTVYPVTGNSTITWINADHYRVTGAGVTGEFHRVR
jgi:hypothetical protein